MPPIFDPLDPAHAEDPWARLAELRRECPVSEPRPGIFFVARDADARAALRDYAHLSNAGNFQIDAPAQSVPSVLPSMDPPQHGRLRRLLLEAFTPRVVTEAQPFIEKTANALVDAFESRGAADLVAEFAGPLPVKVISHMVGVPEQDHDRFYEWTLDITAKLPYTSAQETEGSRQFWVYLKRLIAERRARQSGPADLVSRLLDAEVDGEKLDDMQILMSIFQLLLAGNETTGRLIAGCTHELLAERSLWERVQADLSLIPAAIEESLRHDPPLQWAMRSCPAGAAVAGTPVPAGSRVLLGISSANRDESVWPEPDAFQLDRPDGQGHLAFGYGIHLCLGAALARLEAAVAMETLVRRLPSLRLAPGYAYETGPSPMLYGPRRLAVEWG